jgi:hypothetical protein
MPHARDIGCYRKLTGGGAGYRLDMRSGLPAPDSKSRSQTAGGATGQPAPSVAGQRPLGRDLATRQSAASPPTHLRPCAPTPPTGRTASPGARPAGWRPHRPPARQDRGRLSRPRPPGLACRRHRARTGVPGGHAPQHDTGGGTQRRDRALAPAEAGAPGRDQGQPARAGVAARAVGRVRDHGLPGPDARRGDHGPQAGTAASPPCTAMSAAPGSATPAPPARAGCSQKRRQASCQGSAGWLQSVAGKPKPSRAVRAASKSSEMDVRTRRFEPALAVEAMTILWPAAFLLLLWSTASGICNALFKIAAGIRAFDLSWRVRRRR